MPQMNLRWMRLGPGASGVVVLFVSAAIGYAGYAAFPKARRSQAETRAALPLRPIAAEPRAPGLPAAQASSLYRHGRPLTFDKLIELLGAEAARPELAPIAQRFAEGFKAEPRLQELYDQYDEAGEAATATEFVSELAELAEFRRLIGQFVGDSATKAALQTVAVRNPSLQSFFQGLKGSRGPLAFTRAGLQAGGSGVPQRGAARGFGAASPASSSAFAPAESMPDRRKEPKEDETRAGAAAQDVKRELKAKPGAHEVSAQLDVPDAGDSPAAAAFCSQPKYSGLCSNGKIRPEFLALLPYVERYGVWGACFYTGNYAKCASALGNAPVSAWEACMQSYANEATCVSQCQRQGLCASDAGYLAASASDGSGGETEDPGSGGRTVACGKVGSKTQSWSGPYADGTKLLTTCRCEEDGRRRCATATICPDGSVQTYGRCG